MPEISKVAMGAVAALQSTATPAEQREESGKHFAKKPPIKVQQRRRPCANNKKLEAARQTLEELQSKTTELEGKRKEAYAELTRAQNGVVATRLAMPTVQEMDLD